MRALPHAAIVGPQNDLRELRLALISNWPALLRDLLGEPTRRTARQWRWNRRGSFSAVVGGPKVGTWFDHESACGGGPLELIARMRGGDWREAADWARRWLGMPAWERGNTRADHDDGARTLTIVADAEVSAAESLEERCRHSAQRLANAAWERATSADASHGYLQRKGIGPHGARIETTDVLIVPLMDLDGTIHTLQRIYEDGTKRFLTGGAKAGHFTPIGGPLTGAETILVCEGWATGATAHEATGLPVVAAMDAGNLKRVAASLRERFPTTRLLILADNDVKPGRVTNPGVQAAMAAARASGALVAVPPEPGDFNDFAAVHGLAGVRAVIAAAEPPPEPMPTYPRATLDVAMARTRLEDQIAAFMAEVVTYWSIDPLDAELAPDPGPPSWAALIGAEAASEAACC
jgi:putative DNA primase/helicase